MVDLVEAEGKGEYGEDADHGDISFLSLENALSGAAISLQRPYSRVGMVRAAPPYVSRTGLENSTSSSSGEYAEDSGERWPGVRRCLRWAGEGGPDMAGGRRRSGRQDRQCAT